MTITTMGRRRVDLGRQDPACPGRWHGTYTAYNKGGCRCPRAREAHRLYQKRCREGRNDPAIMDATGTRRRIQALWAIGHSSERIAEVAGGRLSRTDLARLCRQQAVAPATHAMVAAAYWELMDRPGCSVRSQRRATAAGYPTPIRWGANIDDPAAEPDPIEPESPAGDVDEIVVERVLAGEHHELNDAELIATLQAGTARGESLSALSLRLGINYTGAKTLLGGELTPRRAKRAARQSA